MEKYIMSEEEQAYLSGYDISAFDRPSVAADIAVFSIIDEKNQHSRKEKRDPSNYRKDPLKQLKLLLIRRASFPYKNAWALPGGFCRKGESVLETARRELCIYALQKEAGNDGTIVFDLMPERFTLSELQRAFESVLGKPLLVANFRRKIADYVLETDEIVEGVGHRPAKLFKRNVEKFYQ